MKKKYECIVTDNDRRKNICRRAEEVQVQGARAAGAVHAAGRGAVHPEDEAVRHTAVRTADHPEAVIADLL